MGKKLSKNGIARIDNAFTIRAKAFCNAGSVGIGKRNKSGITIRKKSITKKTVSSASAINPHGAGRDSGGWPSESSSKANLSLDCDFEYAGSGAGSFFFFGLSLATGRKNDNRSKNFAERTATVAAQSVAKNAVPTITVGRAEPAAARIAIAVAGINCTELVLIARKVHIAFDATPGRGFNDSKSRIARNPSGVAALPRPSMFAAMFISIEPIAGWSGGTSGNNRCINGRNP